MWWRNQSAPPARVLRRCLWPQDKIHCEYCGNYPQNGVISLTMDIGCCSIRPLIANAQKVLDLEFEKQVDVSSSLTAFRLARSTGRMRTSVGEDQRNGSQAVQSIIDVWT